METTYQKYKRERNELKEIVSIDVQHFLLGRKDIIERLNYLKKCIEQYRIKSEDNLNSSQ
jgi:hypothetical protein